MNSAMSLDEFITGIIAATKLSGMDALNSEGLEESIEKAFKRLQYISKCKGLTLRFHCESDSLTRPSATIQYAFMRAAIKGHIAKDHNSWTILMSDEEAESVLQLTSLSSTDWRALANQFEPEPFVPLNLLD